MITMTTREKLILMDDIKRKNDITWSKYAKQPRRYWEWSADVKKPFNPFEGIGSQVLLGLCLSGMLVLFVMMAA